MSHEYIDQCRIHPQTIIAGWRKASAAAKEALEASASDNSKNEEAFREDLMNIARTTLSSKILSQHKDFFSKLAVDAVLRLKGSGNLDAIQIIKIQGGTLEESFLDEGKIFSLTIVAHRMLNHFSILEGKGTAQKYKLCFVDFFHFERFDYSFGELVLKFYGFLLDETFINLE